MKDFNLTGINKHEIDTPALLIDLDLLASNIKKMASFFEPLEAKLRPHSKTHKCPELAKMQIEAGAIGITCAKLGEAEAMVASDIDCILIANQIVGDLKIYRLIALSKRAEVIVAVDNEKNLEDLSKAASEAGLRIPVLIEVNIGMNRCGVEPHFPTLDFARKVLKAKGLIFKGLMGYEGHVVNIKDRAEREKKCLEAMKLLIETKELLESHQIPVEIVSGGGTGTYDITGSYPGVTEVQAGSYITMDAAYKAVGVPFDCALTLLTTVVSRPKPEVIVTDSGLKSITRDFALPEVKEVQGAQLLGLSEEHTRIKINADTKLAMGDKIELIPNHGCTTVNLHDRFYAIRDGKVEAVWEIAARGKFV